MVAGRRYGQNSYFQLIVHALASWHGSPFVLEKNARQTTFSFTCKGKTNDSRAFENMTTPLIE